MTFLAQTRAHLDLSGTAYIDAPTASELRHEVDADLTSIRYPQAGVRGKVSDRLRLAAVYRGGFKLALDIDADLALQVKLGQSSGCSGGCFPFNALITTHSINAFQPQQVVLGGSFDVTPRLTVDADLTWVNWSKYESPVTQVNAKLDVRAPPDFPKQYLPDNPAPTVILPLNFHDTFVPRIGAEWRIPLSGGERPHELALRAGYYYERSPIPEQTGGTNFVDGDHHSITGGFGIKLVHLIDELPGDVRLDVHGMLTILPERTMHKISAADTIGDYTASGKVWLLGTTLGVVF
jgi:long-chain fatty acid transport protein